MATSTLEIDVDTTFCDQLRSYYLSAGRNEFVEDLMRGFDEGKRAFDAEFIGVQGGVCRFVAKPDAWLRQLMLAHGVNL